MNESRLNLLHNQFVTIKQITVDPEVVNYQFFDSMCGEAIIASTLEGVCYLAFCPDRDEVLADLSKMFPKAEMIMKSDKYQEAAMASFLKDVEHSPQVTLHLKCTPFQYKVWNALLVSIIDTHTSYSNLAIILGNEKAARAVGNAVGRNPVAYLIPCHRVCRLDGLGGYRWGVDIKVAIIEWERQLVIKSSQKAFANRLHP